MSGLSEFSSEELLRELTIRSNEPDAGEDEIPHCDECGNFQFGGDEGACSANQKMKFKMPVDMSEVNNGNYGYYKRRCKFRKPKT